MPCILKSKNKESQFNRPISQSISWSVRQSICQSVSRKELQCRALYLFAANQKAIQKKSISFSVSFVGMNFTKDSLCNVNRLKYNSLNVFRGDLIFRKTKSVPYLPVYNAHLFFPKWTRKYEMRIIHGILCLEKHNLRSDVFFSFFGKKGKKIRLIHLFNQPLTAPWFK